MFVPYFRFLPRRNGDANLVGHSSGASFPAQAPFKKLTFANINPTILQISWRQGSRQITR